MTRHHRLRPLPHERTCVDVLNLEREREREKEREREREGERKGEREEKEGIGRKWEKESKKNIMWLKRKTFKHVCVCVCVCTFLRAACTGEGMWSTIICVNPSHPPKNWAGERERESDEKTLYVRWWHKCILKHILSKWAEILLLSSPLSVCVCVCMCVCVYVCVLT